MVSDSIRIGKGLFAFSFPCDSIYSQVMKWPRCKVNQPLKILPLSLLPAEETLQAQGKLQLCCLRKTPAMRVTKGLLVENCWLQLGRILSGILGKISHVGAWASRAGWLCSTGSDGVKMQEISSHVFLLFNRIMDGQSGFQDFFFLLGSFVVSVLIQCSSGSSSLYLLVVLSFKVLHSQKFGVMLRNLLCNWWKNAGWRNKLNCAFYKYFNIF